MNIPQTSNLELQISRPRSTMDSIRASEAPDTGSIPVEATHVVLFRIMQGWVEVCSLFFKAVFLDLSPTT